jgi:hypothetical protein
VDGAYEFYRLAGTHTVRIDAATSALDFNEELAGSFDASTLNPRSVTVGPDSPANDFGYKPRSAKIINDLETGVLTTNGEPPRFWITVLKAAIKGTTTEFDPVTVLGFLIEIEGLVFPDPFQFTEGSELQEAVAVLTDNSRDPVDQLRVQLLAAELNHVSGKGLVGGEELQEVLISWCESLINRISATVPAAAPIVPSVSAFLPAAKGTADPEIDDANNLLTTINRSARGGGTGGQ